MFKRASKKFLARYTDQWVSSSSSSEDENESSSSDTEFSIREQQCGSHNVQKTLMKLVDEWPIEEDILGNDNNLEAAK